MRTRYTEHLTPLAHRVIQRALHPGCIAVDATMGNGHDTLFLARHVGAAGHVYGLDVQEMALAASHDRLAEAELLHRVTLLHAGHEHMAEVLPEAVRGKVQACMFNLGFLPGSDKGVTTRAETTLAALGVALEWLADEGMLTVHTYGGHRGGQEEQQAVLAFAAQLPWDVWRVTRYDYMNKPCNPEALVLVERV